MAREKTSTWQAEKSEITRNAIMEATLKCYIDFGYANTTVTKIAETARVSRGAMMHHFEDRQSIIGASVTYLTEKRQKEFESLIIKAQVADGTIVTEKLLKLTTSLLWKFFHSPNYVAFQELVMAARTDPELAKILRPAQKDLDNRIADSIRSIFPAWREIESTRELITDLYFYTLQGLAMNNLTQKNEPRVQKLLDHLVQEALYEYNKSIESMA